MIEKMLVASPPKDISRPDFLRWKADPITKLFHYDMILSLMETLSTDLPESIDVSMPIAFQREGARKTIDAILDWVPDSAREVGKNEN